MKEGLFGFKAFQVVMDKLTLKTLNEIPSAIAGIIRSSPFSPR